MRLGGGTLISLASVNPAQATTIGFNSLTGQGVVNTGTVLNESGFNYQVLAGSTTGISESPIGNPPPVLKAVDFGLPNGDYSVTVGFNRSDVVGGLFTFDQVDLLQFGLGNTSQAVFQGFLNNSLVNTDTFTLTGANNVLGTVSSINLSGVSIDQLKVTLVSRIESSANRGQSMDNLVLTTTQSPATPTPESSTVLGLLAFGAVGAASTLKQKLRQK